MKAAPEDWADFMIFQEQYIIELTEMIEQQMARLVLLTKNPDEPQH